jgi:antirestriction protein ArdC
MAFEPNAIGRVTRPLRHNGLPYSGMNVLLLWSEAIARGFANPMWMTFKQALELGGAVRKGETGSMVVFASRFTKTETDAAGEEFDREIPFLKAYSVFNVAQIDGLPGPLLRAEGRNPSAIRSRGSNMPIASSPIPAR